MIASDNKLKYSANDFIHPYFTEENVYIAGRPKSGCIRISILKSQEIDRKRKRRVCRQRLRFEPGRIQRNEDRDIATQNEHKEGIKVIKNNS